MADPGLFYNIITMSEFMKQTVNTTKVWFNKECLNQKCTVHSCGDSNLDKVNRQLVSSFSKFERENETEKGRQTGSRTGSREEEENIT